MTLKQKIFNIFAAVVMVFGSVPMTFFNTYAAEDEPSGIQPAEENIPKSLKKVSANGDGTYDITLEIEGVSSQHNEATKANVVVVFDTSGSMNESETTYDYSVNNTGRYGLVNGDYLNLYRENSWGYCVLIDNDTTTGTVYTGNRCRNRDRYNGTRYSRTENSQGTRIQVAKDAVNVLANKLLSQNDSSVSGFEDVVEMAFVDFATNVNATKGPTTDLDTFKGWVSDAEVQTGNAAGTNWEAALSAANNVSFGDGDNDKTYIIFVSDGNPTFRDSKYNSNATDCLNEHWTFGGWVCDADTIWGNGNDDPNSWNLNVAIAIANQITAEGSNKELYAVGAFGKASNMQSLGGTYYAANNQDALEAAFTDIVNKISEGLSVADLQIEDGITSATSTEIDGTAGNFRYDVPVSWGDDWKKATFEGGSVHWNPGEHKTLSNGEKASVTFTVWPSQEAMDCIASLRNDGTCDQTDLAKFGLGENEDGSFRLITNSEATFRFRTATKVEGSDEIEYSEISVPINFEEERDPTNLPETELEVTKLWADGMDAGQRDDIKEVTLKLKVDDSEVRTFVFNKEGASVSEWVNSYTYAVAPGVMKKLTEATEELRSLGEVVKVGDDEYVILEEGHDYLFDESYVLDEDGSNHYYISKKLYHPMIVGEGGNIHDVTFTDNGDGTRSAEIDEVVLTKLSAENTLNGGIMVGKKVINNGEEDTDITDTFPITITLNGADAGVYRIYTYNPDGTLKERSDKLNYSDGKIEEEITVNQKIRVQDVPTGTTFDVTEDLPEGYEPYTVKYQLAKYDENNNETIVEEPADILQKVFGNASAQAIVTNTLESGDLIISKTVDVESGNEKQAQSQKFGFTVYFYKNKDDENPVRIDNTTCNISVNGEGETVDNRISHEGTCTIENIPKGWYYKIVEEAKAGFNDGEETIKTGTIKKGDNEEEFENVYKVAPLTESVFAKKNFTNEAFWLPSDNFTFLLKYNEVIKDNAIVTFTDRTATFSVTIPDEGEYKYTITEMTVDENDQSVFRNGVSRADNDTDVVATIVVEDNGDGTLRLVSKTYSKEDQTIYNQYRGTTTYGANKELEFEKDLRGREWKDDDEFTFTISSTDEDAPLPEETSITVNKDSKKADFGAIEFTQDHVNNKVYHYTVTESFDSSKIESVVQSDETKNGISFTIEVEYTENGELSLKVSDYDNTFVNIYESASISATKIWADDSDRDGLRGDYDLFVAVKDGDKFVAYSEIDNSGDADEESFTFSGLPLKRDDEEIEYEIVEAKNCMTTDDEEISCEVFDGDETYDVDVDNEDFVITNTHEPATKTITIKKIWDVASSNLPTNAPEFILVDLSNDDNDEVETIRLEGTGYGEWISDEINVTAYKNHGEDINYEVKETGIGGTNNLVGEQKNTLYVYNGKVLEGKWTAERTGALEVKNTWTPATPVYEGSTKFYIKKVDGEGATMSGVTFTIGDEEYTTDEEGMIEIEIPEDNETEEDDLSFEIEETATLNGYDLVKGTETLKVTSTSSFVGADEENLVNNYTKTYVFEAEEIDGYVWNEDTYVVTNNRSTAKSMTIVKTFSGVTAEVLKDLTFEIEGPEDFGEDGKMTIKFSDCVIDGDKATCAVDADIVTGNYTVTENNAEIEFFDLTTTGDNGVEKTVESDDEVIFEIDNEYVAYNTFFYVVKIWDDEHDKDGLRPDGLEVELSADGEVIDTVTISNKDAIILGEEDDSEYETGDIWVYAWEGLPYVNEDAEIISYTVAEVLESDDYTQSETESDEYYALFVNTHEPVDPCAEGGCGGGPGTPDTGLFSRGAASITNEMAGGIATVIMITVFGVIYLAVARKKEVELTK